jgi:hypothetical protein
LKVIFWLRVQAVIMKGPVPRVFSAKALALACYPSAPGVASKGFFGAGRRC